MVWQQFKMVYKALHERRILLKNAAHLAHPLALLTPCYTWFDRIYYRIGRWVYDRIAGHTNLEPSRGLGPKQMRALSPALSLEHVRGGVLYFDNKSYFQDYKVTNYMLQPKIFGEFNIQKFQPFIGLGYTSMIFDYKGNNNGFDISDKSDTQNGIDLNIGLKYNALKNIFVQKIKFIIKLIFFLQKQ